MWELPQIKVLQLNPKMWELPRFMKIVFLK